MKSMVKQEITFAYNEHVDMIQQLVLDAYAMRIEVGRQGLYCDDCVIYRFLRQTGHSTALSLLLSDNWQTKHGVVTHGLFMNNALGNLLLGGHVPESTWSTINDFENTSKLNKDTSIILVSDVLHSGREMDRAWNAIDNNLHLLPNLKLVVYLG
jgi:hypothetical protein